MELAKTVVEACEEPVKVKFLYDLDMPLRQRVELIAKEVTALTALTGHLWPSRRQSASRPIPSTPTTAP